jgi:hypothetical protein
MSSPGVDPLNVLEIDEPDANAEQKTPGLEVLSQEVRRLGRELFRVSRTSERNQQICEEAIAQLSSALAQVSEHSAEAVFQAKAALCQDLFAVVDSLEASCDTAKNLLKQLDGKRAQLDRGFLFQFSKARQLRADWVECVKVMSQWLEGQQLLYQRVMTVLQSAGVRSIETHIAHLDVEVGRDELEQLIDDLLRMTLQSIDRALEDSGLHHEQINRALLVGGSTRIARVWTLVQEHTGLEPSMEVNPDEAVALGAAVQAAIIKGEPIQTLLIDVAPHSLGIEVAEFALDGLVPGKYRSIIRRNTTVPTTQAERFYTITPEQDTVEVCVFQGESPLCQENTALGKFLLANIPSDPDPKKPREVIVEFSYNLNGIVEVTARDRRGERREVMTVSTTATKRAASEPEQKRHFAPSLESDVSQNLDDAARLEIRLESDGRTQDAERVRKARSALERAHDEGDEKRARQVLEEIEDLIYDLEQ